MHITQFTVLTNYIFLTTDAHALHNEVGTE